MLACAGTKVIKAIRIHQFGELEALQSELFRWILAGELTVRIDKTFALADAALAQRYLENRQAMGKLLLIP